METKTSKVLSIQPKGTFESKFGTLYKFDVIMENGDVGEATAKQPAFTAYKSGDSIEYNFDLTYPNYPKIKQVKEQTYTPFKSGGRSGNESFALSYAKDIWVAEISSGTAANSDTCISLANKFYDWLESKKK